MGDKDLEACILCLEDVNSQTRSTGFVGPSLAKACFEM